MSAKPRLSRDAEIMLKEISVSGHKPKRPFVVPGTGFWSFEAPDFEWALMCRQGKWVVVTNARMDGGARYARKPKYFESKEAAKPETALRHFINWWLKHDLQKPK